MRAAVTPGGREMTAMMKMKMRTRQRVNMRT